MTQPNSALGRWLRDHAVWMAGVTAVAVGAAVGMGVALTGRGGAPVSSQPTLPSGSPPAGMPAGAESRLIAVKVDNAPAARPQIGLGEARLVVEAPVEGDMTRFLALFPPGDTLVGPVRSARPVDVDLVPALSGMLVSTGGRPFVLGPLRSNGTELIGDDPDTAPFQTLERPSPHNQFVSLSDLPDPPSVTGGFPVGDWPEGTGGSRGEVGVPYPTPVTWSYRDGVYTRAGDGETFTILGDWEGEAEPLTTQTVVLLAVHQRSAGYTDVNGVEVPTYDVIGAGRAWVHHRGETLTGTWHRPSLSSGYELRADDGTAFGLPDTPAFVHLVPDHLLAG